MRKSKFYKIENVELFVETGIKSDKFKEEKLKSIIDEVINLVGKLQDTEEYDKDVCYFSDKEHAIAMLKEISNVIKE